jgi:zinc D-Ala-D-Ala carboxypeptidase
MRYFTLTELAHSDTAKKLNLKNVPNQREAQNLIALAKNVLDPARHWYNKPIHVTSGFRNPQLNKELNGAKHSQHMQGEAADIVPQDPEDLTKLYEFIKRNLTYDQLILEPSWIHVSYKHNRQEAFQIG